MDYKSSIMDTLEKLQEYTEEGSDERKWFENRKKEVENETDEKRLFMIWQTIREATEGAFSGKAEAPFKVKMPDGSVQEYRSMEELNQNPPQPPEPDNTREEQTDSPSPSQTSRPRRRRFKP